MEISIVVPLIRTLSKYIVTRLDPNFRQLRDEKLHNSTVCYMEFSGNLIDGNQGRESRNGVGTSPKFKNLESQVNETNFVEKGKIFFGIGKVLIVATLSK